MKTLLLSACMLLGAVATANAQTTYVTPNAGGYTLTTPGSGQPPTYITPNAGGYTLTTPGSGQSPTYVTPNAGGYTITTPGGDSTPANPEGGNNGQW